MKKHLLSLVALFLCLSTVSAKTIYCKMEHGWWYSDGAAIAVYTFNGTTPIGASWPGTRMTQVETNIWQAEIDDNAPSCIFVRVSGTDPIADWSAKTADLTIPTDGKNLFTITSAEPVWGNPGCTGTWSTYGSGGGEDPNPGPKEYYLIGFINGANHGDGDDHANLGNYKFTGEPLQVKATFTETSYVYLKTGDNKNWYMTANYVDGTQLTEASATFNIASEAIQEKMAVPAGVELTFTLVENEDGSLTLSFTSSGSGNPGGGNEDEDKTKGPALPGDYYLCGTINDIAEEEWVKAEEYHFTGDPLQLTITFTTTSFIYIKSADEQHSYMASSYEDVTQKSSASIKLAHTSTGTSERIGVPGNKELTFILTENTEDNTLTLSFNNGTALNDVLSNNTPSLKVIENGQLIIIRDGVRYNVLGVKMQ